MRRPRCCARSTRRWRGCATPSPTRRRRPSRSATAAIRFAHPLEGSGFVVPRVEPMPAAGGDVGHVEVAGPRAGRSCAASRVPRRRPRSASARAIGRRADRHRPRRADRDCSTSTGDPVVTRLFRWHAPEPAVRGRASAARRGDRTAARRRFPACSWPAAASARSASPTASPTAARPRRARRRLSPRRHHDLATTITTATRVRAVVHVVVESVHAHPDMRAS